nr:RidA family protein [Nodosilinea sp. TSF1-S3]MDF0367222.1 RidA family protein [Nodosilinea sp. TSF1-S3]
MVRQRAFSGTPWEANLGYCRALRVGQQVFVSGTCPSDGQGGTVAPGDAYAQTQRCFEIIQQALKELGADLRDVVRTRIYVTDMACWEDIARAHRKLFADHLPVNTTVAVPALMHPDMLVEVEVEALCEAPQQPPAPPPQTRILGRPVEPAAFPPVTGTDLDEGCLD